MSKIAIFTENDSNKVQLIHYQPDDLPKDMADNIKLKVDSIPERPVIDPKTQRAYLVVNNKSLEWKVVDK